MSTNIIIDDNKVSGNYIKVEVYLDVDKYNPSHEMYINTQRAHEACKALSLIPNCDHVSIVAMARVLHVYRNGTLVKSRMLSDFYDNLATVDLFDYCVDIPQEEQMYNDNNKKLNV